MGTGSAAADAESVLADVVADVADADVSDEEDADELAEAADVELSVAAEDADVDAVSAESVLDSSDEPLPSVCAVT